MFTAALSIFYWFILSKTENIKKNDGSFCLKDKDQGNQIIKARCQ